MTELPKRWEYRVTDRAEIPKGTQASLVEANRLAGITNRRAPRPRGEPVSLVEANRVAREVNRGVRWPSALLSQRRLERRRRIGP